MHGVTIKTLASSSSSHTLMFIWLLPEGRAGEVREHSKTDAVFPPCKSVFHYPLAFHLPLYFPLLICIL